DEGPGQRVQRRDGGLGVGGLRVVVVFYAALLADELQAVLDAGERVEDLLAGCAPAVPPQRPGDGRGRRHVGEIEPARDLAAPNVQTGGGELDRVVVGPGAGRRRLLQAEVAGRARGKSADDGVVPV